ncbi:MAG: GC-type dockerin domain-anchored protein [Planctomycetota bacterium]
MTTTNAARFALAAGLACSASTVLAQEVLNEVRIDLSGASIITGVDRTSITNPSDGTPEVIADAAGYEFGLVGTVDINAFFGLIRVTTELSNVFSANDPGQPNSLAGFVRANAEADPITGDTVIWREEFVGDFFDLGELRATFSFVKQADGSVRVRTEDIVNPVGGLLSINVSPGTFAVVRTWEPTERQVTEWRFDDAVNPLASVESSGPGEIRYLDEPIFGEVLGDSNNLFAPQSSTPQGVTEAQSSFVPASINAEPADAYLSSSPFNLAAPANEAFRRGIGLALDARTKPLNPNDALGQYTLVMDLNVPASSWFVDFPTNAIARELVSPLINFSSSNADGGDLWLINRTGTPEIIVTRNATDFSVAAAQLPASVQPDTWFRLALVVDAFQANETRVFVDGVFVGTTGVDRFSTQLDPTSIATRTYGDGQVIDMMESNPPAFINNWDLWGQFPSPWSQSIIPDDPTTPEVEMFGAPIIQGLNLFADLTTGAGEPVALANLLFADDLLTDQEIADLGGPDAAGILEFGTPPGNPLDFDGNGVVNISDLFAFITAFTMTPPDPSTDFDGNGIVNISDLFAYINAFTAQP